MNTMLWVILWGAVFTYAARVGGHLVLSRFDNIHPRVEAGLNAVPAAVLTTLVAPAAIQAGPVETDRAGGCGVRVAEVRHDDDVPDRRSRADRSAAGRRLGQTPGSVLVVVRQRRGGLGQPGKRLAAHHRADLLPEPARGTGRANAVRPG